MKTRILSAAVGIPLALGLIVLGAYFSLVINLSIAAIAALCLYEGLSAKGLKKKLPIFVPSILFGILICLLYSYTPAVPLLTFFWVLSLFCGMIFYHDKLEFSDLSYAFMMTFLCTAGLWSVEYLFDQTKSVVGLFYVVAALSTPWLSDAAAYFGGSLMGKHKLCPKISPKKTVEGAVWGAVLGSVLTLLVGVIFEKFFFEPTASVNYIYLGIFGIFGAIISIAGDLSFSLIKRNIGIKDYGSLIPGHGGMLDRFDSVIFTAPLLLVFNMLFPIVTVQ